MSHERDTVRIKATRWDRFAGDEEKEARHLAFVLGIRPEDVMGWEVVARRGGGVFVRALWEERTIRRWWRRKDR